MYSKFGSIKYAQHVFDKMYDRNDASWNNMISGFVRVGWYHKAMQFFCHMFENGVTPSSYVIASMVTACDRSGCMTEGARQIHGYVVKCGLMSNVFVGTSLLHFYGTHGSVSEANKLFEEIEEPNIVSWTSLMVCYADNGHTKEVLNIYRHLRHNGLICTGNTMATVIRTCGMFGDKTMGYQILGDVIKSGLDTSSVSVANSLISMFGNYDSVEEASRVFNNMQERDTISWNSIITASAHNGRFEESLGHFFWMRRTHPKTDYITISALLPACGSAQHLKWGRGLHGLITKSGLESNVCVCNSLLSMYAQAGSSEDAELVFHTMPARDLISWNSMMASHVEDGKYSHAILLLVEMLKTRKAMNYVTFTTALSACYNLEKLKIVHAFVIHFAVHHNLIIGNTLVTMYGKFGLMDEAQKVCKIMPERDVVTWNALIGGHADDKDPNATIQAFNLMRREGLLSNYITIVNLLGTCMSPDYLLKHGMPIHAHIVVAGFELDTYVQSSLITMYAQCGDLNTSSYIFDVLANKNSSTWNAIFSANAHYGPGEEALKFIARMRNDGVDLDQFSFSVALATIGNLTVLDEGQQLHSWIIKLGFELDEYVLNATMDMYGKCGEIDDVFRILPIPKIRSKRSWNILISALARHGFFRQATEAFHEMLDLGLKPDHVTFVSLLSACSHGGLVDEGLVYFSSMTSEFGVPTAIEHCVCIIDLLGRSGRLAEAEGFIDKMPVPPNEFVWRSLLAACKVHGNLELGRKAADRLFELNSSDDSAYVLYSNVCASTQRWGDVENVRKQMESQSLKKKPACSWIKLKNKVMTFGMGDQFHPQSAQIYAKLEELRKMTREEGHMPDTSYALQDTDEEQKEHNLWNHKNKRKMEKREDWRSILPYLPVVMRSSSLFWPSQVVGALRELGCGRVDSGQLLFIFITELRNSLSLSSEPLAPSAAHGYALFFDELISREECRKWFEEVLPSLGDLLLRLPSLLEAHYENADMVIDGKGATVRTGLRMLDSQEAGIVFLTQELIAALLACSFLCLFPVHDRYEKQLQPVNFDELFASLYNDYTQKQEDKIWCIIHYFQRITSNMPKGVVSFERKVLPWEDDCIHISYPNASFWSTSVKPLCRFEVKSSGLIEDHSSETVEVDFANEYLGGGALRRGCVQEEIRFMISPELIAGMIFLPSMADNEAIDIVGVERFSSYTGYASSFRFSGDYVDDKDVDTFGRRKTRIVAIDALCGPGMRQYREKFLLREINKAFCGFLQQSQYQRDQKIPQENFDAMETSEGKYSYQEIRNSQNDYDMMENSNDIGVATGNWGCGAFGGDPEVKTIIQWLAASQAGRPFIAYYTFGSGALQNLDKVSCWILSQGWTVGDLWNMLVEYSTSRSKGETNVGFLQWLLPSIYDHDSGMY